MIVGVGVCLCGCVVWIYVWVVLYICLGVCVVCVFGNVCVWVGG